MTKARRLPSDPLTPSELAALGGYLDGKYRTASQAADFLDVPRRAVGNFGATVRRLYEKGRLSFRSPEGDYKITAQGWADFEPVSEIGARATL